jgi:hypothetical protein
LATCCVAVALRSVELGLDGGETSAGAVEARAKGVELEQGGPLLRRQDGASRAPAARSVGATCGREHREDESVKDQRRSSDET